MTKKNKAILRAANFMFDGSFQDITDLSDSQLLFLESLSIYELSKAMIQIDLLSAKMSYTQIANRYGVTKRQVEWSNAKLNREMCVC